MSTDALAATTLPTNSNPTNDNREVHGAGDKTSLTWVDCISEVKSKICNQLRCERLVLGIVAPHRPRGDEMLVVDGFSPGIVDGWIEAGFRHDGVFLQALRTGAASGTAEEARLSCDDIPAKTPVACVTLPDGYPDRRHWLAMAIRPSGAFTDADLHALSLQMRRLAARFNRPRDAKVCRLLIGYDDRVIHADPSGEAWLAAEQININRVLLDLRVVVSQRWPELVDGEMHDVVFSLSGEPVWIRFQRRRATPGVSAEQWYLELRPLDRGDLPPLGAVDDPRVARAVGYMHDHYAESPSLSTIAQLVDVSVFHFHRTFSKLVGTTPKQYVLQRQVQMAKWMLATQRVPIARIAKATGFASHGHFTSTFRRLQDMSPTEYREQLD